MSLSFAISPTYISARSADTILSDVRLIRLAHDALQAVNVFLDELLYSILSGARALVPERLRAALLKLVPTSLGKDALLEAEVELKSYWERTRRASPSSSSSSGSATAAEGEFDLLWSFELLRLKCVAYSTLNDADEDADAETRLRERMEARGAHNAPKPSDVSPAALYLTAILEAICGHVLSNVSSVTARDSSRAIANSQDLFTALCEDDAIYGTFKTMKAYDQIEQLTKAQRPRRSKSFSRNSDRVVSPTPTASEIRDSPVAHARSESLRSNITVTAVGTSERRMSLEKSRGRAGSLKRKLLSHSRSSSEKESMLEISRPSSDGGRSRGSADFEEDDDLLHEFDELMRSGATMKVSLTPERLKSMEAHNRARALRASQRGTGEDGQGSERGGEGETAASTPSPTVGASERARAPSSVGRPVLHHVDSINEDEEEAASAPVPGSTGSASPLPRTRQSSKSFSARSPPSSANRTRSISISDMPHPRHDTMSRSSSTASQKPPSQITSPTRGPQRSASRQNSNGVPARMRKVVRNRESIDLDDIMGGSEGEGDEAEDQVEEISVRSKAPRHGAPASIASQRQPYISQSARELIAFLDEGPPEDADPPRPSMANASVLSFDSSKSRSGRFSRMMSRLTIGGSMEKMGGHSDDTPRTPKTPRSLGRKPSTSNIPPPPAYRPPSLASKRSFPSVVISSPRSVQPPPIPVSPEPLVTSPSVRSPSSAVSAPPMQARSLSATSQVSVPEESGQRTPSPRRGGSVRKAVPPWEDGGAERPPVPARSATTDSDTSAPSRNGSVRGEVQGLRLHRNGDSSPGEQHSSENDGPRQRTLSIQTSMPRPVNGRMKTPSPKDGEPRLLSPPTPRRSPIPRKPPPSPIESDAGPAPLPLASPTPSTGKSSRRSSKLRTGITSAAVADLRRLLAAATSADECRLLIDMFFARHGYPYGAVAVDASDFPAPPPLDDKKLTSLGELECSLVELFLGGESGPGVGGVDAPAEVKLDHHGTGKAFPSPPMAFYDPSVAVLKRTRSIAQSTTEDTLVDEPTSPIVLIHK